MDELKPRRLWRVVALSGPLAAVLFFFSLVFFAALRTDGYTHGTKAVSELGALDAPNAIAFNLLGFILPGLLIITLAIAIAQLKPYGTGWFSLFSLVLSGMGMLLAGLFPVDMLNQSSSSSTFHAIGAMSSGLFWAISLWGLGKLFKDHMNFETLGRLTPWFWVFIAANLGWQIAWQATGAVLPGWGQRIAFSGYFIWAAWAGVEVFRRARLQTNQTSSV
jgi:hypothetical membrane protein